MFSLLLSCYRCFLSQAHERSLNTDILFGLLKKIRKHRPELRVIISSATVDALIVKQFFESNRHKNEVEKDDTFILQLQVNPHASTDNSCRHIYVSGFPTLHMFNNVGSIAPRRRVLSPGAMSQLSGC